MTDTRKISQSAEYRLVLIDPHSMRIVTSAAAGSSLPRVSVPAFARVAECLTEVIHHSLGLRAIQLALLPGAKGECSCAVHEILGQRQDMPQSLSFSALDEILATDLSGAERTVVLAIMRGDANHLGRFARLGWIDELLAKTSGLRDLWPISAVRQLNQGIDFCLLSMTNADGRTVWFKAVGEPNTREYALTQELARRFPIYLPKLVATIPEWNGWMMEDVQGSPLSESDSIDQWERAFAGLASLQQETANDVASLFALGAKDWRYPRIASLLEPFFQEAQRAMTAQTSARSTPLSSRELYQLQKDVEAALVEFMNTGVPETLLHGDIGHGNVLATAAGPVFLDWAEAAIGHPFLSAEHLLADLARSNPLLAKKQAILRSHYAASWKSLVEPELLEEITVLAPAVAALVYAIMIWESSQNLLDPSYAWPLMRSMLRRTKRELDERSEVVV